MAHPNETILRDAYAAFGRGDVEGYLSVCTPDFSFNVPGNSPLSGSWTKQDSFIQLVGQVMERSGGKFEEIVQDVLANDTHGVVLALHRVPRNGEIREYETAHVYNIQDGKLTAAWEQPRDPAVFDAIWS